MDIEIIIQDAVEKAIRREFERFETLLNTEKQDKYFTRIDAAKYLKISGPTLSKQEKLGKLVPTRIGTKLLYSKNEMDKFLSTKNDN